jgi:type I restriction enzyme S subunit
MIETLTTSLKRVVRTKITDGPHTTPQLVDDGIPFISAEGVVEGKIDFSKKRGFIKRKDHNDFSKKLLPQYGDIFFVKSGSTTGKIAFVETKDEFNVWSPLALIRVNDLVDNKLLFYILQSPSFQLQVRQYWSFGTQPNIGMNKIEQLKVTFPKSKKIQKEIVKYLDVLFEKTNHFIQTKQRFIELLKEQRQSIITNAVTKGIDENAKMKETVLGEIPEHWAVRRLKFIAEVNFSTVDKHSHKEEKQVRLCNYVDVYKHEYITNDFDFMIATATDAEIKRFTVEKGDVIITKDSETAADIAIPALVVEDLENVVCAYHLAHIKPNRELVESEFLFRLFQSKKINSHFEVAAKGVTRHGLSYDDINSVFLPYPPTLNEQQEIIKHIKTESRTLDIAISKAEREIELIKEYREAMIAEAVTGKMKL